MKKGTCPPGWPHRADHDDRSLAREAERCFGVSVVRASAHLGLVYLKGEGKLLRLAGDEPLYRLWGQCPACGQGCWSQVFDNRLHFSERVGHFDPSDHHRQLCPGTWRYRSFGAGHSVRVPTLRRRIRAIR